jgi:YfiH family protein
MRVSLIEPNWPRHPRVRACMTTRAGGTSRGPYASLNLATHVGDEPAAVLENRRRLRGELDLIAEPGWLSQVHGIDVIRLAEPGPDTVPIADAAWTDQTGLACVILTADCVPVLLADDEGTCVAAAHAGWRGLAAGVLENTVGHLPVSPRRLSAWLGPSIGPDAFEVGQDVFDAFVDVEPDAAAAFVPGRDGRHLCDLHELARRRLSSAGVSRVESSAMQCTLRDATSFFSHRRDGTCGRMATLVWLA